MKTILSWLWFFAYLITMFVAITILLNIYTMQVSSRERYESIISSAACNDARTWDLTQQNAALIKEAHRLIKENNEIAIKLMRDTKK